MRCLVGLSVVTAMLVVVPASAAASAPPTTEVLRWSPFDSGGSLKASLTVRAVQGGCIDIGYTYVGGVGYRCASGNDLFDACFRDGPNSTEYVICVARPWDTRVVRLHSPHLLLYPGVTFTAAAPYPWGIVLDDGNRCAVVQGAHGGLTADGKRYTVDYECEHGHIALLREGMERRRVWEVNAARLNMKSLNYTFLGRVPARRVYFGTLPPPLEQQNMLAHKAYSAAVRVIRKRTPTAHLDLAWVRLALPRSNWAYVIFTPADASLRGYFALLHLVAGRWHDASADKPYCTRLPRQVRQQLFLARKLRHFPPESFLAPHGETRC